MTDLSRLPDWPARMQSASAAAYMGLGLTKFLNGVKEGRYPQPIRDGGNVLWHRVTLDQWLANERGEVLNTPVKRSWGGRRRENARETPA